MNQHGRTAKHGLPIIPERILLGRLALLSREGNHRAVAEQLREWFDRECPANGKKDWVRENGRNRHSDPLTLAIAELDLDARIANALETHFGVLYVQDLERWRSEDLIETPNMGPRSLAELHRALEEAGCWEPLQKRRRAYAQSHCEPERSALEQ